MNLIRWVIACFFLFFVSSLALKKQCISSQLSSIVNVFQTNTSLHSSLRQFFHLSPLSFCLSFKEAEHVCFSCSVSALKFPRLLSMDRGRELSVRSAEQRCSLLLSVSIGLCALPWIYNTFQSQLGHALHTQQGWGPTHNTPAERGVESTLHQKRSIDCCFS